MKWKFNKYFIILFILFLGLSCSKKILDSSMYGVPVSNTGLSSINCNTACKDSSIISKEFSSEELQLLREYTNSQVIEEILENPYKTELNINSTGFCAVVIEDVEAKKYHLETFSTQEEALEVGAVITHVDACGACSTLQDLAVYAENLDLGATVRKQALRNFTKPFDSLLVSMEAIGLTKPCAQIWAYNVRNTQAKCFAACIANNRYNKKDGSLSNCLQCDETKSGPVFKAVAGRTRRNTGIANAICRFCSEVEIIDHNYGL